MGACCGKREKEEQPNKRNIIEINGRIDKKLKYLTVDLDKVDENFWERIDQQESSQNWNKLIIQGQELSISIAASEDQDDILSRKYKSLPPSGQISPPSELDQSFNIVNESIINEKQYQSVRGDSQETVKFHPRPNIRQPPPELSLSIVASTKPHINHQFNDLNRKEALLMPNNQKRRESILRANSVSLLKNKLAQKRPLEEYYKSTHFAFLFASPLVLDIDDQWFEDMVDEIGFKEEFQGIQTSFQKNNIAINYRYQLANDINLQESLKQKIVGLHFSGHGLMNDRTMWVKAKAKQQYIDKVSKKGDMLVFEDWQGGVSQFLFESDLKVMLAPQQTNIEFVVVASCHSEQNGKIFRNAGVKHVICVKKTQQLNDDLAARFSQIFYYHVFDPSEQYTICQSFEIAKDAVRRKDEDHSQILIMYTYNDHTSDQCSCKVKALPEGKPNNLSKSKYMKLLPAVQKKQVARNLEAFKIMKMLTLDESRIVQVFGIPGVGKTAIIQRVVNYVADRDSFKGGIVYINFTGVQSLKEAFNLIHQKMQQASKVDQGIQVSNFKLNQTESDFLIEIQSRIESFLRDKGKILLVFDNLDDLIQAHHNQFVDYLKKLMDRVQNVQIMVGASIPLESIIDGFFMKSLDCLKPAKARQLFIQKLPSEEARNKILSKNKQEIIRLHNESMKNKLWRDKFKHYGIDMNTPDFIKNFIFPCAQVCKLKSHLGDYLNCINAYLDKHPMFSILNRPLIICLAASQLNKTENDIVKLFDMILTDDNFLKKQDQIIFFIDSTLQMLSNQSEIAVEMLYLIGEAVTGLSLGDLEVLFMKNNDVDEVLKKLKKTSLIQIDADGSNYKLQNFFSKYLQIQLTVDKTHKEKLNSSLIGYFCDEIIGQKQLISDDQLSINNLFDFVNRHEKNIIHCIQYVITEKCSEHLRSQRTIDMTDQLLSKEFMNYSRSGTFNEQDQNADGLLRMGSISNRRSSIIRSETTFDNKSYNNSKTQQNKDQAQDLLRDNGQRRSSQSVKMEKVEDQQNLMLSNSLTMGQSSEPGLRRLQNITEEREEDDVSQNSFTGYDDDENLVTSNSLKGLTEEDKEALYQKSMSIEQGTPEEVQQKTNESKKKKRDVSTYSLREEGDDEEDAKSWKTDDDFEEYCEQLERQESMISQESSIRKEEGKTNNTNGNGLGLGSALVKGLFGNLAGAGANNQGLNDNKIFRVLGHYLKKKVESEKVRDEDKNNYSDTLLKLTQMFKNKIPQVAVKSVQVETYQGSLQRSWSRMQTKRFKSESIDAVLKKSKINNSGEHSRNKSHDVMSGNSLERNYLAQDQIKEENSSNISYSFESQTEANPQKIFSPVNAQTINTSNIMNDPPMTPQNPNPNINANLMEQIEEVDTSNDQSSQDEKEVDLIGQTLALLYNFMSVIALSSDKTENFWEIREKCQVDQLQPMIRANIDLLLVYMLLKAERWTAAADINNDCLKIFTEQNSIQGQAICNYFMAFISRAQRDKQVNKAIRYLKTAKELFKLLKDEEAADYCRDLKVELIKAAKNIDKVTIGIEVQQIVNLAKDRIRKSNPDGSLKVKEPTKRFKLSDKQSSFNLLVNQVDFDK